jgi:hypothetical protein
MTGDSIDLATPADCRRARSRWRRETARKTRLKTDYLYCWL